MLNLHFDKIANNPRDFDASFKFASLASLLLFFIASDNKIAVAAEIHVDCANKQGMIRPLHGVNGGPLNYGETVNLSKFWREIGVPSARLHDCEWPGGRIVDFKAIFPSLSADPTKADNYSFEETDEYVKSVLDTGASIVYRLGESIEHSKKKHRVHPPTDMDRWAAVCVGIIRHYNDGWAKGFHHKIRYWEIWNEPENRPAMWTGTDNDYFRLYRTTARAIKSRYPDLKVGGPSAGSTGKVVDGVFQPNSFLAGFLHDCKSNNVPLDFFSWHTYTDTPSAYVTKAHAIRRWLDDNSFAATEIHLNEWNYLPDNDWGPILASGQGKKRQDYYDAMGGPRGAAFIACVLLMLQDSPIDVANIFSGDSGPFGLFTQHGEPKKTFHAMRAFRMLLSAPERIRVSDIKETNAAICAGIHREKSEIIIMLSNYTGRETKFDLVVENLPWKGTTRVEILRLDEKQSLDALETRSIEVPNLTIALPAPTVAIVKLRKA